MESPKHLPTQREDSGYKLIAKYGHRDQLGRVDSPYHVVCPYCPHRGPLVYVEVWDRVPGYPETVDGGAPPYVNQLKPAMHVHGNCPGTVFAGAFILLV